jgi:hypothetical protein
MFGYLDKERPAGKSTEQPPSVTTIVCWQRSGAIVAIPHFGATASSIGADVIFGRTGIPRGNDVRFGLKADISQCNRHVPFTPESGHS